METEESSEPEDNPYLDPEASHNCYKCIINPETTFCIDFAHNDTNWRYSCCQKSSAACQIDKVCSHEAETALKFAMCPYEA